MESSGSRLHESLHEKALDRAKAFHRAEADMLDVLQELDSSKTYLHYYCTSLFQYCVKYLKLSEANTLNFITVARKAKEVPELKEAIRKQELTVCKARKLTPVITKENSDNWIELAKTLPKLQLEKAVAKVDPKPAVPERAKYITEDRVQVNLAVSENIMQSLRRAQDLVSQSQGKPASLEDTLAALVKTFIARHDPTEKAKRYAQKEKVREMAGEKAAGIPTQHVPGTYATKLESRVSAKKSVIPTTSNSGNETQRNIPAKVKHQVFLRDQGQCTHTHNNNRCENKRWIDLHHRIPRANGGINSLENLTTLCRTHHRLHHSVAGNWHSVTPGLN